MVVCCWASVPAAVATLRSVWSGTVKGVGGFLRPDPPPPVIVGGFGPKMAGLAGRVGDGINLPGGPGLARLVEVARTARAGPGAPPSCRSVLIEQHETPAMCHASR